MNILYDVSDDLLSLSRGDLRTYQDATSRFVSSLEQSRASDLEAPKQQPPPDSDQQ